jgi:hypothetical protein
MPGGASALAFAGNSDKTEAQIEMTEESTCAAARCDFGW